MNTIATTTIAGSWQAPGLMSLVANISLPAIGQIMALVKFASQQAQKGYQSSLSLSACLPRPVFATPAATDSNHAFRAEAVGDDRGNTKRARIIQGGNS
jgi:hypothetical protein